jgi:hypothetical protein
MKKHVLSYDSLHDIFLIYYQNLSYVELNKLSTQLQNLLTDDFDLYQIKNIILEKYPLIYDHIDFTITYKLWVVSSFIEQYNKNNNSIEQTSIFLLSDMTVLEYCNTDEKHIINSSYNSTFEPYVYFKQNIERKNKLNRILNN